MPVYVAQAPIETGELISTAQINQWIDNIAALHLPSYASYSHSGYSTLNQTSFTDIDGTNLNLSIATTGGLIKIGFYAGMTAGPGAAGTAYIDLLVDGARIGDASSGLFAFQIRDTYSMPVISFVHLLAGKSAATHTFKIQYKVSAGASINLSRGQFWVEGI